MVFIRRFSPDLNAYQNHDVGKKVGNGVNCIRYEGLALAEYAGLKLEQNQYAIDQGSDQRYLPACSG